MLGWFKKKFSKDEDTSAPQTNTEPQQTAEITQDASTTSPSPEAVPKQQEVSEPIPQPDETEEQSSGIGSMFQRLSTRLNKTKESLVYRMDALFLGKKEGIHSVDK